MEKSTKIGLGLFVLVLAAGFMITQQGTSGGITGNVVAGGAVAGGSGEVVEVRTVIQGYQYNPDTVTVKKGSKIRLTIENKDNVLHGLHLPQFGIVGSTAALTTKTVEFDAIESPTNGQAVPTCSQEHGETLTFNVV